MSELNSCAYCGESMIVNGDIIGSKWSQCNGCESRGPLVRYHSMCNAKTVSSAINASNTRAPQSEWISVNDYLPTKLDYRNTSKCILAYSEANKCMYTAVFDVKNHCFLCFHSGQLIYGVTEWMPTPPKAEK